MGSQSLLLLRAHSRLRNSLRWHSLWAHVLLSYQGCKLLVHHGLVLESPHRLRTRGSHWHPSRYFRLLTCDKITWKLNMALLYRFCLYIHHLTCILKKVLHVSEGKSEYSTILCLPGATGISCRKMTSGCCWITGIGTDCVGGVPAGTYRPWKAEKEKAKTSWSSTQ